MNKILNFLNENKVLVFALVVIVAGVILFLSLRTPNSGGDNFLKLESERQKQIETDVLTGRRLNN